LNINILRLLLQTFIAQNTTYSTANLIITNSFWW